MREQEAGWVLHRSDVDPSQIIEHPAVVLRVKAGRALIVHGTGTERPEKCVRVDHKSSDGVVLVLTKPTFFYARGATLIVSDPGRFRATVLCPPDLFLSLRKMIGL